MGGFYAISPMNSNFARYLFCKLPKVMFIDPCIYTADKYGDMHIETYLMIMQTRWVFNLAMTYHVFGKQAYYQYHQIYKVFLIGDKSFVVLQTSIYSLTNVVVVLSLSNFYHWRPFLASGSFFLELAISWFLILITQKTKSTLL